MAHQYYSLFDTVLGPCGVAWSEGGLMRLQLPEADRHATETRLRALSARPAVEEPPQIGEVIGDIQNYLAGAQIDFSSVAVDLAGVGPFDRKVYDTARSLVWGQTASYGELARRTGAPGLARAVGQALSRNPIPIVIPCHRILAAGNKIGGFSAYGGTCTKELLLSLEGVRIDGGEPRLPGL